MARGIFEAHLAHEASEFYRAHFADPVARSASVSRALRPLSPEVFAALAAQNDRLFPSDARARQLEALGAGAAAVVTGQQVGLFLGPLYTLYKAMTAIRAAQRLSEETHRPVVPVFWVQSEDHDLPEVATYCCPEASHPDATPLELTLPAGAESRVSLEHRALPPELQDALTRLESKLDGLPFAGPHLERLRRYYQPGAGYVEAFTGLLAELTAEYGLVFVNPRDPALAAAARPLHREALSKASAISEHLLARGRALAAAGYEPGVHVRPGAPLAFFHPEGPTGPRYRLSPAPGGYTLQGGPAGLLTTEALMARLDAEPRCFSTSALLRPLLQDQLLPTAAYVGGPAEIAYLAQIQPLYPLFGMEAPLVLPRARIFVVEPAVRRALERLGLSVREAASPEPTLLERGRGSDAGVSKSRALREEVLGPLLESLEAERGELAALGPGLERALDRTLHSVERNLKRLIEKTASAERAKDQTQVALVQRLHSSLYPKGVPQERVFGLSYFAARHGEQPFLRLVHDALHPFDAQVLELNL